MSNLNEHKCWASKASAQSNHKIDTKLTYITNEASTESKDLTELDLFTLAVPTDGTDTPSLVNAWIKKVTRRQL